MNTVETPKRELSIKAKIYWLLCITVALCMTVIIPLVLMQGVAINGKIQKNVIQTAVLLVENTLANQITKINIVALSATMERLKNTLSMSELCVFNREMIVLLSDNSVCSSNKLPFLITLKNEDKTVAGYLYAHISNDDQQSFSYQIVSILSIFTLLFFAVTLVALKLKRMVTEPLAELSGSVKEFVATNDYHVRAKKTSDDEIGQLTEAFNSLLIDMRKKEHDLIKAKNKADEANELKGSFLASVSHEIRTPMNGIIGTTELLIESLEKQKQKNYASTILRSSESLLAIINDVLDFSKIESGKLDIESIAYNLYAEIEDVADLMAIRANEKNIEIILAISPYVPEFVIGDPSRLRQVLNNLVNNAIKFTDRGHILIEVDSIGCSTGETKVERLRFSVTDTGIGISDEAQNRIFERFTQAESSITRQYGGTGLGLAICKQLVELLGGKIQVESLIGKGSTFSFILEMQIDLNHTEPEFHEALEGVNALIVDDNPYFLEHMRLTLRYFGMKVMSASSSKEALRLIDNADVAGLPFNVILIDEDLPIVSGCALAEKIGLTFLESAPPIIMLNNMNADSRHEDVYSKLGITACIQKPVRLRQLTSLIELALEACATGQRNHVLTVDELHASGAVNSRSIKFASPIILIAETSDIHYTFMAALVIDAGCRVVRARDGDEVIAYCLSDRADLLIIDLGLAFRSKVTVIETLTKIQQEASGGHIPIIATAANNDEFDSLNSYDNSVIDVLLHKQVIRTQLLDKLVVCLPQFVIDAKNDLVYFQNTHLLLVEDNRVNAQIAIEILQEFGCDVELCENGKLALEQFMLKRYDAVLMDCQLPIMDGFESTRHMRYFEKTQQRASTPIIALTANAMKGDSERCYTAGMDAYITKPIKREKLREILSKYIKPENIIIKVIGTDSAESPLIAKNIFEKIYRFTCLAGIEMNHYLDDIGKCLFLMESQLLSQSAHTLYESSQSVALMCELFGFEQLNKCLMHLSKNAFDAHSDNTNSKESLILALRNCKTVYENTRAHIFSLQSEIDYDIPLPTLEVNTLGKPNDADQTVEHTQKTGIKYFCKPQEHGVGLVDQPTFDATKGIFKQKFSKVIAEYLEDSTDYLQQIEAGVAAQNYSVIRESAHPLKSSSYTLGLCGMGDIAKRIESCAKSQQNLKNIETDLLKLLDVFVQTKSFLKEGSCPDV